MSSGRSLFLFFILSAVIGQLAVLAVVYINDQKPELRYAKILRQHGIVELIDQQNSFIILNVPEAYEDNTIQRRKIYFDENTILVKQDLLEEDGIIYSQTEPVLDLITNLKKGDRASIFSIAEKEKNRFYATYIIHGIPFPRI